MDRSRINSMIFIILIFFSTWCSSTISDPGKVTAPPPTNSSIDFKISPLPSASSSIGGGKDSKEDSKGDSKGDSNITEASGKEKKGKDVGLSKGNDTSNLDVKDKEIKVASLADPPVGTKEKANGNKDGEGGSAKAGIDKTVSCEGATYSCTNKTMIACIQALGNGSKDVSVLVQNVGDDILRLHINILPSVKNVLPDFQLQKHESKMINVTLDARKSSKVILKAGNGECVFQMDHPVSVEDFLQQLSIYSKQMTPIYGAYVFFLVALLFGGTWACCQFRKRGVQGGVQYQELEMGLPESSVTADVESAEGWDQDWDDNWDDENDIVKTSSAQHGGRVSANGLAPRASRTDGWENDWDD